MKYMTDKCLKESNNSIMKTVDSMCFWGFVFQEIKKELKNERS